MIEREHSERYMVQYLSAGQWKYVACLWPALYGTPLHALRAL